MFRIVCLAALIVACEAKKPEPTKATSAEPAADQPAVEKPAAPQPTASTDPRCEALRDKYLTWQTERVKDAIGPADASMRAELQAQADKELAIAKEKFVGACIAMGTTLDESCFVKDTYRTPRETRDRCRKMMRELDERMFATK